MRAKKKPLTNTKNFLLRGMISVYIKADNRKLAQDIHAGKHGAVSIGDFINTQLEKLRGGL